MKEREFLGWILDVAARTGWRAWHVPMPVQPVAGGRFVPSPRGKGLPDLILLHDDPPRLVFAEVKGDGGKLSEEQVEFLRLARGVADGQRALLTSAGELLRTLGAVELGANVPDSGLDIAPVGVYSWRPGNEELIEAVLVGKLLVPYGAPS